VHRRGVASINAVLLSAVVLLTGCAGSPAAAPSNGLRLPTTQTVHTLAQTTVYTSPDGGIYQNPDPLQIIMVARAPASVLSGLLPSDGGVVTALQGLGDFTFIAVRIHNGGQAGSDQPFNVAQIASDFAPKGTDAGPLRQYYHPMFTLAMLSPFSSDSSCTVHVDPGQTSTVVLVYPPVDATATIVWGEYDDFALRAPFGGGLPPAATRWLATPCVPPTAPSS